VPFLAAPIVGPRAVFLFLPQVAVCVLLFEPMSGIPRALGHSVSGTTGCGLPNTALQAVRCLRSAVVCGRAVVSRNVDFFHEGEESPDGERHV
jgi:hypothetical protein